MAHRYDEHGHCEHCDTHFSVAGIRCATAVIAKKAEEKFDRQYAKELRVKFAWRFLTMKGAYA